MNQNIIIELRPEKLIEDKKEFIRFLSVIMGMEEYSIDAKNQAEKMDKDFQKIGKKYTNKLSFNFKDRIKKLKEAISHNQNILNNIIKKYKPSQSFYSNIDKKEIVKGKSEESKYIYTIFTYIIRDWTIDRKDERKNNYDIIIKDVLKHFPSSSEESKKYKFLIPGSALNRLGYELCRYGYDIEGNDYLFLNGIFSDYIFNHCKKEELFIYPNIDSFSNYYEEESVFKKYYFPDIDIDLKNKYGKLKMTIGGFINLYRNKKELYDCVITCYFIDTAQNIIEYIDIIYNILKKGGIWINFGPLSYHWADYSDEISIELPYDKLKEVICNYGFEYINESFINSTFGYIDNYMHNDYYKCIYFIVKKN